MPPDFAGPLLAEIDPVTAKVLPFDGFVLVCGGPLPQDHPPDSVASVRHFAVRQAAASAERIAARRVIIAERATVLMQDGQFGDLLEFEEHLAALAACVLIFLESAGAIAELGSFAVLPALRNKVMVISEQVHAGTGESFIELGPLSSLRKRNKSSVQVYPMHVYQGTVLSPDIDLIGECWPDIEKAVSAFAARAVRESAFKPAEISHQLLLIAELATLFQAVRTSELHECLVTFGCPSDRRQVERSARLLEKFSILELRQWGHDRFYVPTAEIQYVRLKRRAADSAPFDRLRFQMERIADYEKSDQRKHKALKALRRLRARK